MTDVLRGFDESLPMALLRAREAAMRLFRPLLADHDLTEQQWRVLRALASADQASLEVNEIVAATFLLAPSLSRILTNLEERGLVSRTAVAEDQRRSAIALTSDGDTLVATVGPQSEAIYARIEAAFGTESLAALMTDLAKFRDATTALESSTLETA